MASSPDSTYAAEQAAREARLYRVLLMTPAAREYARQAQPRRERWKKMRELKEQICDELRILHMRSKGEFLANARRIVDRFLPTDQLRVAEPFLIRELRIASELLTTSFILREWNQLNLLETIQRVREMRLRVRSYNFTPLNKNRKRSLDRVLSMQIAKTKQESNVVVRITEYLSRVFLNLIGVANETLSELQIDSWVDYNIAMALIDKHNWRGNMNLTWSCSRKVAEEILFSAKKNRLVHRFTCAFGLIVDQPNSSNIFIVPDIHENAPPTTSESESDEDDDTAFHFSASDSSNGDD